MSVTAGMRKTDLRAVLTEFFVDEELLKTTSVGTIYHSEETAVKLKELELQIQIEQRQKVEAEVELARLRQNQSETLSQTSRFDPSKHIRLVPPFQDKEVDKYFLHFEKVAGRLDWPSDMRTLLLQSVLTGKAQEVYSALPIEQSSDYKLVKAAILRAYEQVPEAYRQKFRNKNKQDRQSYIEFSHEKETLFDRWCRSCNVGKDFAKLRQVMLLEDFKSCVPDNVKAHLEERQVKDLHEAAVIADDYVLTHKTNFTWGNGFSSKQRFRHSPPRNANKSADVNKPKANSNVEDSGSSNKAGDFGKSSVICSFCQKAGHIKSNCFAYQKKFSASNSKPVAFTTTVPGLQVQETLIQGSLSDVREDFLPFVTEGFVSLGESENSPRYPVVMLRDTGASQSLLLKGAVPLNEKSSLGSSVQITGVGNDVVNVPLHHVFLESDLVSGPMSVGVTPTLPLGLKGITLLLGNDVAGTKVLV